MGKVVMYSSVSVDGFVADENDQPGPLFDWLTSGDVPLDESGEVKVSQTSYDYTRAVLGPDRGDNRRPTRLRHDGRLGREASERDRPRGRRDAPAGARWLGPRGAVSLRRRRRGSREPRRRSLPVTASSRSPLATSVARCLPRAWSTRCAWTSYPSCSGPASATSGRSTRSTCWRDRVWFRATGCFTCAIGCAVDRGKGQPTPIRPSTFHLT